MLSCESVSAQWYLFPGRKKRNATSGKKTEMVVPAPADTLTGLPGIEETAASDGLFTDSLANYIPDVFKVSLVLPFQANGKPSSNFLEMYCGALLALHEAGKEGSNIELSVIDESDPATPLTDELLNDSHLIIGPVSFAAIKDATAICPDGKYIVSPLDPKAASLTDSCRVIQAPAQWMRQADEVVRWIAADSRRSDEIVVFKDTVRHNIGEQTRYLLSRLEESGCKFRTEARISEFKPSQIGTSRIIIASDRDSYINGMVRDLSVVATQKQSDIVLYGTSSIRGSLGVDIEHLHNLQAHYTTCYFIDYDDPAVSRFILSYRALFKSEPGQFAFQGYDTMHYFLGLLTKYGVQWHKKLPEYSERGLQTDYFFTGTDTAGNTNTAVRKVILGRDLSSVLIK